MADMRILLVDDDEFLRDMYATKFTEAGDEVVTAKDAQDALRQQEEKPCNVILMDMVLPGMTGSELIAEVKKIEGEAGKAQCIVLSNQSEESHVKAATDAGAAGYIIKAELIPSEVVAKVHEIVNS